MPRGARQVPGEWCYHVLNRGNGRQLVFRDDEDYASFLQALVDATKRVRMRLLAYCLMPNHFHLVVWPYRGGDLSRWMHWLTNVLVFCEDALCIGYEHSLSSRLFMVKC